jgi:hypothetical protein
VGRRKIVVIAIFVVAAVVVIGAFCFLAYQNSRNDGLIKADFDTAIVNSADLPSGWSTYLTEVYSYTNTTGIDNPEWNWNGMRFFNYSSDGRTWHLTIYATLWNSTVKAHEDYYAGSISIGWPEYIPIQLGDEGCSVLPNDTVVPESQIAMYHFRVGNIYVEASFDADGTNIQNDAAFMKGIMDIQAAKFYANEQS